MSFFEKIKSSNYIPKSDSLRIKTIDMHTGGEPLRVIMDGYPKILGDTVLEKRKYLKENLDHLRTALMFEPRGHADMYGCLLVPPNAGDGDFGIIFMHNEGYSTMCGHAVIAISTLAAELGWINLTDGQHEIKIDAPCGRIVSFVSIKNKKVESVKFHCVPSFVSALDLQIEHPMYGSINFDLAYGGAFYAYVDLSKNKFDFDLDKQHYQKLIQVGMEIKRSVMQSKIAVQHPFEEDLSFLYGTIFIDGSDKEDIDSKNVCIFAEGEVDRCPTGSGVSGRMAIHHKRNELSIGKYMAIESIIGTVFHGSIVKEVTFGGIDAVIPEVQGTAHITGQHEFIIDHKDPQRFGFFLR